MHPPPGVAHDPAPDLAEVSAEARGDRLGEDPMATRTDRHGTLLGILYPRAASLCYAVAVDPDWDWAAPTCGHCGHETFRLLDGLCPRCSQAKGLKAVEAAEDQEMRSYYARRLRAGTVSLQELREGRL